MFARFTMSRHLYAFLYIRIRPSILTIHITTMNIILAHCNGRYYAIKRILPPSDPFPRGFSAACFYDKRLRFRVAVPRKRRNRRESGKGKGGGRRRDRYDGVARQSKFPGARALSFLFLLLRLYIIICYLFPTYTVTNNQQHKPRHRNI